MKYPRHPILSFVVILLVVGAVVYGQSLFQDMAEYLRGQGAAAPVLYVVATALSVVLLPLSSLPLIPIVAVTWGVVWGSVLSILGWWIGAIVAFAITRRYGRRYLDRFMNTEGWRTWQDRLPPQATFVGIVIVRMVLPVDIPSFILGLTTVSFRLYAVASLVGMIPFTIVLVAGGEALAQGIWLRLAGILLVGGVAFAILLTIYNRYVRRL